MPDIRDLLRAGAGPGPRDGFDEPATAAAARRLRRRRRRAMGGIGVVVLGAAVAFGVTTAASRPVDVVLAPRATEPSPATAATPSPTAPTPSAVPLPPSSPPPPLDAPATGPPPESVPQSTAAAALARLAAAAPCEGTGEELATWFQPLVEPGVSREASPLTFDRIPVTEALAVVAVPGAAAEQADCALALRNGDAVTVELRDAGGATLARAGSVAWFGPDPQEPDPPRLGSGQPFEARLEGAVLSGAVLIEGPPGAAARRFLWVEAPFPAGADRYALARDLHLGGDPAGGSEGSVPAVVPAGSAMCDFHAPMGGGEFATCDAGGAQLVIAQQPGGGLRLPTRPVPNGERIVSVLLDGHHYAVRAPVEEAEADVVAALASVLAERRPSTPPPPPSTLPDPPVFMSALNRAADRAAVDVGNVTMVESAVALERGELTLSAELAAPGAPADISVLSVAPLSDAEAADPPREEGPQTRLCGGHRITVTGAVEAARALRVLEYLYGQLAC